jgi:RNA polymerase sigma factor (TIGR02999 family)
MRIADGNLISKCSFLERFCTGLYDGSTLGRDAGRRTVCQESAREHMDHKNGDITRLLPAWGKGGEAEQALFELLEPELRRLARSSLRNAPDFQRKIQPDELVNETYLRLQHYLGTRADVSFENRRLFFGMILKVMRHILLDLAKKGGEAKPRTTLMLPITHADTIAGADGAIEALAFYEVLDRLRAKNEAQAAAIELHYIVGWTLEESAELMGISTATLKRQLAAARQWFEVQLADGGTRL